ncbi:unnamed protein product [Symbiodinium natans]|uniref:Uncharacterized protein n=1 Tax=Symbiodinium natans TaxID=878477 RepID=A0A812TAR5_9DINO|nr:unnamed protein product [Symbiodinium natans]
MATSSASPPPGEAKPVVFVHNPRSSEGSPGVRPSPVPDTKHESIMQEFVHAQMMTILQPFVDQLELLSDGLSVVTAQTADVQVEVSQQREQIVQHQGRLNGLDARVVEGSSAIQEVNKKVNALVAQTDYLC